MTLDRTTYEAWLLDRMEGALTPEQERELDAFLAANPDLPADLGAWPSVDAAAPAFAAKELLRKHFPPAGAPDATRLTDFLIARLEGTLSAEQEQQLERYLYEHPDAVREAKLVEATRSSAASIAFTEKAGIERHFPPQGLPDAHRLTDFLIAAEEGDLTAAQRTALAAYLAAHPQAQRDARMVQAARMAPEAVVFTGKAALKKREVRVVPLWTRLAAAASVLVLIGLGWWVWSGNGQQPQLANGAQQQHAVTPRPVQRMDSTPSVPQAEGHRPGSLPQQSAPRVAPTHAAQQPKEHGTAPLLTPQQRVAPAPQPVVPTPEQAPAPALAQTPAPPAQQAASPGPALAQTAPMSADAPGTPLATFVANTVRGEVLDAPERNTALDGDDAVAMVDKGLHAITGGTGGVQVQRTAARQRVRLQLGRNFGITASRSR